MDAGGLTIKAAAEFLSEFPPDTDADGPTVSKFGGGAGVEAELGAITVGAAASYGVTGGKDEEGEDVDQTTIMSAYAYATMSVGPGTIGVAGGYNLETIEDVDDDAMGMQVNLAYVQDDVIIPGMVLETGFGYGSAEDHDTVEATKMGAKVKLIYKF
jgi:hypothetical protein